MTLSETQTSRHPAVTFGREPLIPGFRFCRKTPSRRAVLTTPVDCPGAFRFWCARLPAPASSRDTLAFPDLITGRHPQFNVSRLAQASLALRPDDSLTHLTWAWSEGFDTIRYQMASLLSYTGIPKPPVVGLSSTGGLARSARTLGSFTTYPRWRTVNAASRPRQSSRMLSLISLSSPIRLINLLNGRRRTH